MTRTIAHRGFAGVAPENTVGAVIAAAEDADMVEVDVQLSADGDVIVFHDDRLDDQGGSRGITDSEGYVWETATESLRETRILGSDQHIPTLDELLTALPTGTAVNVELKNPGTTELRFADPLPSGARDSRREVWEPLVNAVATLVDDHPHDVLLSSFYEGALAAARKVFSAVPLGVLLWDDVMAGLEIARRYDAEAVHPPKNMIVGTPLFETEYLQPSAEFADVDIVELAHDEGREVNVWTVKTWYEAFHLDNAGVDGLIADYPRLDYGLSEYPSGLAGVRE